MTIIYFVNLFPPTKASRKPQLTAKFVLSPLWLRQAIKIGWFAATAAATKGSKTSGKGKIFIFKLPNHPADFSSYPNFFRDVGVGFGGFGALVAREVLDIA